MLVNMDPSHPLRDPSGSNQTLAQPLAPSPATMHRAGLDEGYSGGSEETRSLSDSEGSNMQLDNDTDMDKMQPANAAILNHLLSLPAEERAALAAALVMTLPESNKSGN